MISLGFEYYKPRTIKDAVDLFMQLELENKNPIYYAGGTEFISMARMNKIKTEAIIDIKGIPECHVLGVKDNYIFIGSAITLNKVGDSNLLPLLSKVVRLAADRTMRNKITLGGNICGKILYKEAVLPFLLFNSTVKIAGPKGEREINVNDLFNKDFKLENGEILIQIITDANCANLPNYHIKRTKQEKVDYPLVSASFVEENNYTKLALSGMCNFPFRSYKIEDILNDSSIAIEQRVKEAVNSIEEPILDDLLGSANYRKFVLQNIIIDYLQKLGRE